MGKREILITGLGLFLLALLIRLPHLGNFMTIDEVKWVEGAGQFTSGLANGNLFATYWHFFPGVTTTWVEAFILWLQYLNSNAPTLTAFVENQMANLPGIIGAMRLSQVLITSIGIAGLYWLARPLLGNHAALLGVGLLAVDPFFVGHSRIVNGDAGSAVLMMMALLAFAGLWQTKRWPLAVLAGIFAGLALLTKLPAPIILPVMLVPAALGCFTDKNWRFWLMALLLYGAAAAATFVLLFPAMWVNPLETLRLIYVDVFNIGGIGEGHDTFFMGQISRDPGKLFYPYAIAFRLTPVTLAGLLTLPFWLWRQRHALATPRVMLVGTLLIYIIFVYLFANVSPKKLDRYVMAVIPALLLLAGTGWVWLFETVSKLAISRKQIIIIGGSTLLIAVQALFVIQNYPYVLTYYNPLLGGFAVATEQVPVGWGEGMEQAAAWLNAQPNASNLRMSGWYSDMIRPYLQTQTRSFSSSGKGQLEADYVIFYVNQVQRQKPNSAIVDYFAQTEPSFQVEHSGVPYVWVYAAPAMQPVSGKPKIEGRAQLLGYRQQPANNRHNKNSVDLTLFMSTLGDLPLNETFDVALAAPDGTLHGNWTSANNRPWQPDAIVEWRGMLTLLPNTPPGEYTLVVRLMDTNIDSEVTRFQAVTPPLRLE